MQKTPDKQFALLKTSDVDITRYAALPRWLKVIFLFLTMGPIGVAVYYLFGFSIGGYAMINVSYYYILMAGYLSAAFLVLRARKRDRGVPWYDLVLAALAFVVPMYFFLNADSIVNVGWTPPTPMQFALALILWVLTIEGARRMAGYVYPVICVIFGLYPVFAGFMPGILYGFSSPFVTTIGSQVFGTQGLLGLPMQVTGNVLIGFLIFAGILMSTGAGKFFLGFALALLGRFRGGPAKVSVVSSALFGTLSGSAISNVISTGCVTIPTMKRIGYPPNYAGAVEAVSSTGGILMPPVMGPIAFIMAVFLAKDYATIIAAAFIPAILYYFGLLMQVDAYAAKVGLRGLPREELPRLRTVLKDGWPFLFVLFFLVWGLVYMRWEGMTPFYASGLMILLSFYRKETMLTPRRLVDTCASIGKLIAESLAILLPVGLIVSGFTITGIGVSLTAAIVNISLGNVVLILLLGAAACYVMGMAGLVGAAYIFLAVTVAPAVIKAGGLNVIAVHLFIVYWTVLAAFTLPVAPAAFVAAAMAGAGPMKTAWTAMRLAVVIYFIPFFFVFNPALVLQGPIIDTIYLSAFALIGVTLIAAALQGYLLGVGMLNRWVRLPVGLAGFLITFPEWVTTVTGVVIAVPIIVVMLVRRRRARANATARVPES